MNYNTISYFQFDNLLRSRVPMALIVLEDLEIQSWFNSIVRMHLENITFRVESKDVMNLIQEKKWEPHMGIIVLDRTGKLSPPVVSAIEKAGFLNVFSVQGGYEELVQEKNSNQN